jgi:hypothetical protein
MSSREDLTDDFKAIGSLRGVNETLDALKESQTGAHCLMVYPDTPSLRAIYSRFTKIQLENNNDIVLILPYYETTDAVRLVLSGEKSNSGNVNPNLGQFSGIDVEKYEKEGSLIIRDSLKANVDSYEEQQEERNERHTNDDRRKSMGLMEFLDVLIKHTPRRRKDGVTVLLDMGLFHHSPFDHQIRKLEKFEATIPKKYEGKNLKVFCLYHQKDFERRFNQGQQAILLDYHSRNIMLISADR